MTAAISTPKRKEWPQVVLGVGISLIALGAILYLVDLRKVWAELIASNKPFLLGSGLFTLVWLGVRTLVWRSLLQDKVRYGDVFLTLSEGYLLNNVLPMRLGEVGRAFLLSRKAPVKFMEVLTTILLERAFDVLFAVTIFLAGLTFVAGNDVSPGALLSFAAGVMVALVALYLMARFPHKVMSLFEHFSRRWGLLNRIGMRFLPSFLSGLAVLTDFGRFVRTVGFFLLNLTIAFGQYFFILWAFFPEATLLWAALCLGASSIGMALPSSPGSVGVFEGSIMGALALFSPNVEKAFACAVVLHFWNYFFTTLIGAYALTRDGQSLAGLYARMRQARHEQG